ncbi:MAG TPA: STAS domain-containing protein [Candidatus Acidoferrales bacterium]|jgi:anti-sigma B factor antagonist|nr:STAS domain-containing protein [Candidatus Acidoferrales bacterium]
MRLLGTCRDAEDVSILDFSGDITLGEGSATLRKMVRELVDGGKRKILLNLAEVQYIDSAGVGELVNTFTVVRGAGGELKIASLTKRVHDVIQLTRLYTIFDVQPDERSALSKFRAAP